MTVRRRVLAVGLALAVLLAAVPAVYADIPGPGWWTAQQIQATEGVDQNDLTTVQLTAYDQTTGTFACGNALQLRKGEAFVFVPTDQWGITPNCGSLPSGFQGSAVVSADRAVVAIVEATNQNVAPLGASGGTADAAYRGTDSTQTDTILRFPAYKNQHAGETSTFYIQNAGAEATTLRATFKECQAPSPGCSGTGATYTFDVTTPVQPNRMAIITPADAGAAAGNGKFGSLTVESLNGQKLAGVVNEAATTVSGAARYLKSTRAFAASLEADAELYAPVIKHTYPLNSGAATKWSALQIQNAGTGAGDFTITYTIANSPNPSRIGTEIVDDTTCVDIAEGQTCFVMPLYPVAGSGTSQLQAGEYAAAKVTGNVDMVAVVNEETLPSFQPAADKQFATYSAIPLKSTSAHVSVPAYKEEWAGRYMGVTVQNVSGAAADITATIKNANVEGGASVPSADLVAQKVDLLPGAAVTFWLLSQNQAQQFGGVSVVSGTPGQFVRTNNSMELTSDQPMAVIVNQENSYVHPPATKLDAATYEGLPLP